METRLAIRYAGPAVDGGTMPVHTAAAAMVAFSEYVVEAVKKTCGEDASATANVRGFQPGSFIVDLVFHVTGVSATLLSAGPVKDVLETINESFALWKHLRGAPPTETRSGPDNRIQVTNNNGVVLQVNAPALNLVLSEKAVEGVRGFVGQPLRDAGIGSVEVVHSGAQVATADSAEAEFFSTVAIAVPVSSNTIRMTLIVDAASFRDGLQWRFSDGQTTFTASLEDADFLRSIESGARFGKGDRLDVDLVQEQTTTGTRMSVTRKIVKVHKHLQPMLQAALFGVGS